jgi:hypothetical protein
VTSGAPAISQTVSRPVQATTTHTVVLAVFAGTLFLSATLLFVVEPLTGKMLLPVFGGTPGVWNTCLVFFQAALLAGYAYAHASTRWLGVRRQALAHLVVLSLPLLVLPIATREPLPRGDVPPVAWLLWRLLMTVGLPFFVVSATAPLLQKWFSQSDHPAARDPYFLYAASNAGSLLALLGYPLVIEPLWPLATQSRLWTIGYAILAGLVAVCALFTARHRKSAAAHCGLRIADCGLNSAAAPPANPQSPEVADAPIAWRTRGGWLLLAAAPSSLMLGVTAHITTDLAAVPLLWVVPLALYLLTFVFVFARRPLLPLWVVLRVLPFVVLPLAIFMTRDLREARWVLILLHLVGFFVLAMACHGRLAAQRPTAQHLTEYYLWMSLGGVVGGLFNALLAPRLFSAVLEYPLAFVLACAAMPAWTAVQNTRRERVGDGVGPLALLVFGVAVARTVNPLPWSDEWYGQLLLYGLPALVCFSFVRRPVRFGLGVGAVLLIGAYIDRADSNPVLHRERNFFGVKKVVLDAERGYHVLVHGGIIHGAQSLDPLRRHEPLTYYHRTGPIADVFEVVRTQHPGEPVATIGLGTGSVASYAQPGQRMTFYEIDPAVARLAAEGRYFSFLPDSVGLLDIVLGDGRLTLGTAQDGQYAVIVLDAFSSDAIPTHLLTREALQLYLSKLADDGLLAFHVSNRYLDLTPVLADLAAEAGLECRYRSDFDIDFVDRTSGKFGSDYVVLARSTAALGCIAGDDRWARLEPGARRAVWTDQFSNILSVMQWE